MSPLNWLILLMCFRINLGWAERTQDNLVRFRDRRGNIVEFESYAATYRAAGSKNSVPILTKKGFDVSKMEIDYQRSYVLLYSGRFKRKIENVSSGHLYIFYTENVKYCNDTAVAYEIFTDMNLSDFKYNRRSDDLEFHFGRTNRLILSKRLLTDIIWNNNNINEYYEKLYCKENIKRNNSNCQSAINSELIEEIMIKFEDSIKKRLIKKNKYINMLEASLKNATNLIKSCQRSDIQNGSVEFRKHLTDKLNQIRLVKGNSKSDEEIPISKAIEWHQKSVDCQKKIDRLQNQLDGKDNCITTDPYYAILNGAYINYTCISNDKIIGCINYLKAATSITEAESGIKIEDSDIR